ncbi:radical SAM/SPASM protein FxsB, inactivated metallohydrolase extension form [Streptomyces ficellus]|uniref:Radical SAM/SPASM protein FxsB, inactivated metallohydrolase extension form n=1 Tax=Streptomyces ficellus TaxID=1977088 RepID=A0ABT7Z1X1_9ACTN|nr:radical SAM/SPASM protein FxsB, inactivated metallohydrolase extension form [Streptomyces ficellus]MDN3293484.1 radical SAM/SPASM protein FxsB, inactivated metallohydrolase extension form [Streptomyces ficellus]
MTGPLVPFREIVLKVHSRCDLSCDHCYIYEHADQSWRTRPKAISDQAISWTALRLAEHAEKHALPSVSVILHGGEPLLAGPARLRRVCEELTAALAPVTELDLRIHTNGLRLSPRYLDLFDEYGVKVGISLDGDKTANDRHRRFADGRSSHPLVLRAVDLLRQKRYRHLNLGLLCTIDVANDPVAVYDALTALDPPRIDFLLPHATWEDPPPRPDGSPTAYADWILTVFDRWNHQGRPVPVRLFASVLSTLDGGPSLTESLGLAPTDLVVVETDGTLEQVDSLKSAYEGAAATGFDVYRHSLDDVAAHPGVRARQLGLAGVGDTCRRCPVVRSCGGGLYTHRYRHSSGFDNPSVYCADLEALVRGIEARTAAATAPPALTDPGALLAEQHELTRVLLAELHSELDGRGGERWAEAWELAGAVERRSDGLDEVLAHPYTRTWLLDCLDALREERPGATGLAGELARYVAAAAVRGGLDVPVRVAHRGGALHLPTLGTLRLDVAGDAEVWATGDGLAVRAEGTERRVERLPEEGAGWRPVRHGAGGVALDDLDPYRHCFDAPAAGRLTRAEAADFSGRLERAWALLRDAVPEQAGEAAAGLRVLTPLAGAEPSVGRHGYGALGLPLHEETGALARALLRGFRRAKLRALLDVADLYALDGAWSHPAPWREAPVPVSALLAGAYERVGLAAYEEGHADHAERALDLLESAAELTVGGKLVVRGLREELSRAQPCRSRRPSAVPARG